MGTGIDVGCMQLCLYEGSFVLSDMEASIGDVVTR